MHALHRENSNFSFFGIVWGINNFDEMLYCNARNEHIKTSTISHSFIKIKWSVKIRKDQ